MARNTSSAKRNKRPRHIGKRARIRHSHHLKPRRVNAVTGQRYRRKLKSPSKMRWVPMAARYEQQDAVDAARARARSKVSS